MMSETGVLPSDDWRVEQTNVGVRRSGNEAPLRRLLRQARGLEQSKRAGVDDEHAAGTERAD